MKYIIGIIILLTSCSCISHKLLNATKIKTIKIGEQKWIIENLHVSTFINGDTIPEAKSEDEWEKAFLKKKPAWCYYKKIYDYKFNGRKYLLSERKLKRNSKLYNWYAVCDSRLLAPTNWHNPTDYEWSTIDYLGGKYADIRKNTTKIKTVKIGEYQSIFENQNISTFSNGDTILEAKSQIEWEEASSLRKPAWCYYKNIYGNKNVINKYVRHVQRLKNGKLYNWFAVNDSRALDRKSYQIPYNNERTIIDFFSGKFVSNKNNTSKIKTVKIGEQEWMDENLNVVVFRNGDTIPEAKSEKEWKEAYLSKKPAWCYYYILGNKWKWNQYHLKSERKLVNGKLYNWYAVNDPRGLTPVGSHVPSDNEWSVLITYLGGKYEAGKKIQEIEKKYLTLWNNENSDATNETGFTALLSGCRNEDGIFYNYKFFAFFWTATELDSENAFFWRSEGDYLLRAYGKKGWGLSVRCVMDK